MSATTTGASHPPSPSRSSRPLHAARHAQAAERLPVGAEWGLVQGGVVQRVADPRDLVSLAASSALLAPACCSALGRLLPGPPSAAVLLDSAVGWCSRCARAAPLLRALCRPPLSLAARGLRVGRMNRHRCCSHDGGLLVGTAAWCCARAARAGDTEAAAAVAELLRLCSSGQREEVVVSRCLMLHLCVAIAWRMGSAVDVLAEHWNDSDCASAGHDDDDDGDCAGSYSDDELATVAFALAAMHDDVALLGRLTQPPFSLDPGMAAGHLPQDVPNALDLPGLSKLGEPQPEITTW
eukprot:m51a1_g14548 hypothetical protein (295) ;mRNA; r:984599-988362